MRVRAYRQDKDKRSALHMASEKCLTGTVAKLLLLGTDAALADGVWACVTMCILSHTVTYVET